MTDIANIEKAADNLATTTPDTDRLLYSIALSVKRIADKLDGDLLTAPVNQYGESFTDAIQNGLVRGQNGISTHA